MTDHTIHIGGQNYDIDTLTCEDLRVQFRTGRDVHISGTGKKRVSRYRTGVLTNIGDIEISVWTDLMWRLIIRLGETEIQEQLQQWIKEHCAWVHTASQVEQNSLEFHAARTFDDPVWTDYIAFNRRYRSEVLKTADLVWVKRKCCGKIRQMTREHFEWIRSINGGNEYCHDCGDYTILALTDPPKEGDDLNE